MKEEPTRRKLWLSAAIPGFMVFLCWMVFILEKGSGANFAVFGIFPREWDGLKGILFSPFLHSDLNHLVNNSVPLLVLGTALFYFYPVQALRVILISLFTEGILVWFFARDSYHIGASGVVYSLAFFLFASGILRKDKRLSILSLLVVFLYGGMVWGIFPQKGHISWESHFAGAFCGVFLAVLYRGSPAFLVPEKNALGADDPDWDYDPGEGWYDYLPPGVHYDFKKKENE